MMNDKEKYLNRIKKLLALARNNSSPEEAALAMRRASLLMDRHRLSEADATLMDISEASTQNAPSHAARMPEYMALLAGMISRVFGVKYYSQRSRDSYGMPARRTIVYYGPAERPQVAAYAFEVLGKQMMKSRREYLSTLRKSIKPATKTARADAFCSAWVQGAYAVVSDFVVTEPEETLMQAYRQKMMDDGGFSTLETRAPGKARGVSEAACAGYYAGRKAELHHAVSGSSTNTALLNGENGHGA